MVEFGGTSRDDLVQHCCSRQDSWSRLLQGTARVWLSPRIETPQPLRATCLTGTWKVSGIPASNGLPTPKSTCSQPTGSWLTNTSWTTCVYNAPPQEHSHLQTDLLEPCFNSTQQLLFSLKGLQSLGENQETTLSADIFLGGNAFPGQFFFSDRITRSSLFS